MTAATAGRSFPRRGLELVRAVPRLLLVALIRVYQTLVSPMTGPSCRYYPSCSQYALVAVQRHGALRGSWLAGRRLLRCHPWSPGGVDDVPPAKVPDAGARPQRSTEHATDPTRSSTR
ncbi:membrane protein insertion efficiency factor YidD [Cellulomonas sp. APG4]|uniref:membrane protein insertion efficiency factor YidD n=1 Tax=Cellulomonas sp. APG4 TaxID=1538656 RepID=UPI00137ACACE|nr:membrane protein insertion efficiency factor YidD [Cellulomonas sp. APG4]NCT91469.1 membrane protein insertion efficiency factor YidD [Cellulomonas sp. APG4]